MVKQNQNYGFQHNGNFDPASYSRKPRPPDILNNTF